ncbi:MAG TPA: EAL domain-containing protein [Burkholderiales bacterium]|nr:EAL domain-containing protein [Burkholderiales bacterium]
MRLPGRARPRLLPLAAPLVIIAGALAVLVVAGMELFGAAREYVAGSDVWTRELLVHFLLAAGVSLVISAVLMAQRALQRIAAAENALRKSEERMRLIADNVPALIGFVDDRERFQYGNRIYGEWLGVAPEALGGRTVAEVFGAEAYATLQGHIRRVLAGEETEFELPAATGVRERTLQVSLVPQIDADGRVLGFYLLGNDVTPLKRAQEDLRFAAIQLQQDAQRLEFLAHHDPLTGLPNRAMFADRAREAVAHARRHGKNAAFLFIDLDNFKQINDRLGHHVGDGLLKAIAARLRATVRGDDFVARLGGDEFCVLLQDIADPREAAAVAQKLVYELGAPIPAGSEEVAAGASIGIACVPADGEDVPTLMRLADAAMYRAKHRGRNGYEFFSAALGEEAAAADALAAELRAALERDELFLVYQPRMDAATRQVVGVEALLRWNHPRLGVLAPEAFLPLADDTGLLVPIGARVLREACRQGRRWLDAGIGPLTLVVNVTARQLRHGGLADQVQAALRDSGLPGESLLIELPEAAVREIPEALEAAMKAVVATGVRLGVDDFGTGYASLPALQRLRVSAVCIDRQLIAGVPADAERASLARALITLARGLAFEVAAKGVQNVAQRDFLAEAGCRIVQGDLTGAAAVASEIEPVLRRRRAA